VQKSFGLRPPQKAGLVVAFSHETDRASMSMGTCGMKIEVSCSQFQNAIIKHEKKIKSMRHDDQAGTAIEVAITAMFYNRI
jgi:hypothetical protein